MDSTRTGAIFILDSLLRISLPNGSVCFRTTPSKSDSVFANILIQ